MVLNQIGNRWELCCILFPYQICKYCIGTSEAPSSCAPRPFNGKGPQFRNPHPTPVPHHHIPFVMDVAIAKHYRLTDPYPTTWSDPIEDNQVVHRKATRASTARYSVLQEEGMSLRSSGNVLDTTVPQDEADPLGTTSSVVRVLRQKGLPVDENIPMRESHPDR